MGIGTSNRTAVRYVPEVTFGTTPATPTLQEMRYTGESLNYNLQNIRSNEIRSDRNVADLIQVSSEASGDINWELSYGQPMEDLFEQVLGGTWATNVLKNGVTARSLTIQKHFQDAFTGSGVFINFAGARLGGMEINVQQGQIVTGKFSVMALSGATATAQIAGATITPPTTSPVMSAVSNIANIKENGVASTEFFSKLTLNVNNNLRGLKAISSLPNIAINYGTMDITGAIEMYFQNKTMLDRYLAATSFALSFEATSGADKYTFTLPKVKFETGQVVSGGLDQDIMFAGNIRAIYDSTAQCMIQIDRTT